MIEKEVVLFFGALIFIVSATLASATGDVAYIYKKNFKIDNNIVQVFEDLGLHCETGEDRTECSCNAL